MILLGCLLAFGAAVAPRVILILAWIFSSRWALVWRDDFIVPLLGIIFLPYTTIMYMLAVTITPSGPELDEFGWLWIILGLFLDFMKWSQMWANRNEAMAQSQKYYNSGASRSPTGTGTSEAAVSSGQMPSSTSPSAPDSDTSPTTTPAAPPDSGGGDADSDGDKGSG